MNQIQVDSHLIEKAKKRNFSTKLVPTLNIPETEIEARLKYYYSIPQPAQKSQEWLDQRTNYITASAFGHTLGPKWNSNRNELLKEKVSHGKYKSFFGNEATRWGEKYEDIANYIYCYRNKCDVKEFGMIPHPDYPFLGASTDGITSKLINLEIKCPYSRRIKPGDVKQIYWQQMQLQMAVLDLELSHFLECTFNEYPSERDFYMDFNYDGLVNEEKGIIIEYVNLNVTNLAGLPKTMYIYSPIPLCQDQDQLRIWHKQNISKVISSSHQIYIRSHYWVLDVCSCVNVVRDREWFDSQIEKFVSFWKEVVDYRNKGGMDTLEEDININKPKRAPRQSKIIHDPNSNKKSLMIDDDDGLPPGYILSSSDEEIIPDKSEIIVESTDEEGNNLGCLLDSSDEENNMIINKNKNNENKKNENNLESSDKKPEKSCLLTSSESSEEKDTNICKKRQSPRAILRRRAKKSKNEYLSDHDEGYEIPKKKISLQFSRKSNSSNNDLFDYSENSSNKTNSEYQADDDDSSSGSDEEHDSPPVRPQSKQVSFYKSKKTSSKRSRTSSRSSVNHNKYTNKELVNLQDLDLRFNQIETLPEGIFDQLINLQVLDLDDNKIETLPESIFNNLGNLQVLYLYNNKIETLPENIFNKLVKLQELYLTNNKIKTLPERIFDKLVKLQELNLSNNKINILPKVNSNCTIYH